MYRSLIEFEVVDSVGSLPQALATVTTQTTNSTIYMGNCSLHQMTLLATHEFTS